MKKNTILIVDDEERMREVLKIALTKEGYSVLTSKNSYEAMKVLKEEFVDLVITDLKMPEVDGIELLSKIKEINQDLPVIIITAYATVKSAVEAMKKGAYDYIVKPFENDEIILVIEKALRVSKLIRDNIYLKEELKAREGFFNIIGESKPMQEIFRLIKKVSQSDSNVLITGETGTGKELIAKAIHFSSKRADGQFVTVNCAAIPEDLLESELFGYKKGAFTGAIKDKIGKFELADEGTIFLDEIGDMSLHLQAKLLRVIQDKRIEPLGSNKSREVDYRIITATNKDLESLIEKGKFREDLFYRINVIHIKVPPLRERKEDIPLLVNHFIEKNKKRIGKNIRGISKEGLDFLISYNWPGNVRELESVIERAVILSDSETLSLEDLIPSLKRKDRAFTPKSLKEFVEETKKDYVEEALRMTNGNKREASKILKIDYATLYRILKK